MNLKELKALPQRIKDSFLPRSTIYVPKDTVRYYEAAIKALKAAHYPGVDVQILANSDQPGAEFVALEILGDNQSRVDLDFLVTNAQRLLADFAGEGQSDKNVAITTHTQLVRQAEVLRSARRNTQKK